MLDDGLQPIEGGYLDNSNDNFYSIQVILSLKEIEFRMYFGNIKYEPAK